jgi:hypothetical protein
MQLIIKIPATYGLRALWEVGVLSLTRVDKRDTELAKQRAAQKIKEEKESSVPALINRWNTEILPNWPAKYARLPAWGGRRHPHTLTPPLRWLVSP